MSDKLPSYPAKQYQQYGTNEQKVAAGKAYADSGVRLAMSEFEKLIEAMLQKCVELRALHPQNVVHSVYPTDG